MGASCSCLNSGQVSTRKNDTTLEASPEDQLPQHRGKPNSQQAAVGGVETPPELQKISLKIRSLERGMPGSLSSPSLLAEIPDCGEADVSDAAARASSAKEEKMQRTMSWNQAPAIISRMTSWKEAGKDYSAMQMALQNFPSNDSEPSGRATSVPSQSVALQQQDRELSSAPELFTDAAMRNALRKIAALQAKPQPRSRASSAQTSAFVSSRVSSEGEATVSAASRDGSPGGHDAPQKNLTQMRPSYSSELSGLPPGSRVASSDAGSRPGSRPASTDAYFRGIPAQTFNSSTDILSGQYRRQTSSELLLGQHSRPVSVDGPAQAHSSRGPSGDVHHSSRASSAQLAPMQRSSSEATAALSATSRASDEHLNLHHSHPPGEGHNWQEHGGHALGDIPELAPSNYAPGRSAGPFGAGMARQWGPAASGMRRVPENRAAEAFEVLMSKNQGSEVGSINSEDAAAVSAYVGDNMAHRRTSTDSGRSAESRVSSVGKLDGSAVVTASDAHAALKRALSLVKKQENGGMPLDQGYADQGGSIGEWHAIPREQKGGLKVPTELKSKLMGLPRGSLDATEGPQLQQKLRPEKQQPLKKGPANGYSARTSDAAVQAFVRGAFSTPSQRSSAETQGG